MPPEGEEWEGEARNYGSFLDAQVKERGETTLVLERKGLLNLPTRTRLKLLPGYLVGPRVHHLDFGSFGRNPPIASIPTRLLTTSSTRLSFEENVRRTTASFHGICRYDEPARRMEDGWSRWGWTQFCLAEGCQHPFASDFWNTTVPGCNPRPAGRGAVPQ